LALGEDAGACSDFPTGWPGIAVPPGSAHSPRGVILKIKEKFMKSFRNHHQTFYMDVWTCAFFVSEAECVFNNRCLINILM